MLQMQYFQNEHGWGTYANLIYEIKSPLEKYLMKMPWFLCHVQYDS